MAKAEKVEKSAKKFAGIDVEMKLARETKNTYRYELSEDDFLDEDGKPTSDAPMTVVYIQKAAFNGAKAPKKVTITITGA